MPKARTVTPAPVSRALRTIGADIATWRKLRRLTVAEVADRAGVSSSTVVSLEHGRGASLENTLRIARALGVAEQLATAIDPYATDVGRLRADEALPLRVRRARPEGARHDE